MKKDSFISRRDQAVFKRPTHTQGAKLNWQSLLEISQSSVAEAKRRQAIPADWYLKLFEKLGVNPDWLKKGNGRYTCAQRPDTSPATGTGRP